MRPPNPLLLLKMLLYLLKMVTIQPLPEPSLSSSTFFFSFSVNFFLGAQCVLGFLILLLEQYFHSNLRKMFLPSVYGFLLFLSLQLYQ